LKYKVDINSDLGESYGAYKTGNDEKIMPHITSANIACGFHAGDPTTIAKTVNLAKKYHVAVGAHPSFPDLMGFGRREMHLTSEEVRTYIIYQISALEGFARIAKTEIQHVKPHGALYNMAVRDEELSKAIVEAIKALNSELIVFAMRKSALASATSKKRLRVAYEFFADRAYNPDGSLVSRSHPKSLITEPRLVVRRAIQAVKEGTTQTDDGETVNLDGVHTICVHGDTPSAAELVAVLKKGLTRAGIAVEPVGRFM
jgi:UPF0271 protein